MRIGFITQLLWPRYGSLWQRLVAEVGADIRIAGPEEVRRALADPRLSDVAGLAFRLAGAEAIALSGCDLLLVPDLNPGSEAAKGGGQDPWIASFPEALAAVVSGLPPTVAIPAGRPENIEQVALETLLRLCRDPLQAGRAWQRVRATVRRPETTSPLWPAMSRTGGVVAVLGQPWLLSPGAVAALDLAPDRTVSQHQFDPAALRREGRQVATGLLPTDLEVLGAAHLFGRRGAVTQLHVLADREAGSDAWLIRRIEQVGRKPVVTTFLQDLADPIGLLLEGAGR